MIYVRLFTEFFLTGLFAVGGGAATIPFLSDISVKTGWFTQTELADMIAVAESTPGPIGVNMASYAGFNTAGIPGAVVATLGIITPSVAIIIMIARVITKFRDSAVIQAVFYGLRPASAALIASACFALAGTVFFTGQREYGVFGSANWRAVLLAAALIVPARKIKTHPIVFIAFSAALGVILKL
jgi:chromate transporter